MTTTLDPGTRRLRRPRATWASRWRAGSSRPATTCEGTTPRRSRANASRASAGRCRSRPGGRGEGRARRRPDAAELADRRRACSSTRACSTRSRPGDVVIDMGSSEPTETREARRRGRGAGRRALDAPVSGGVRGAGQGTLTIMVGGAGRRGRGLPAAARDRRRQRRCTSAGRRGPRAEGAEQPAVGDDAPGQRPRRSQVGQRFGLDPEVMLEAINGSTGRSYSTEHKMPEFVLPARRTRPASRCG